MINFRKYPNMTRAVIPSNITLSTNNFSNAFNNMRNLVTSEFNHPNVNNMSFTYYNCSNLTGNPVCGNKVTDMYMTYFNCTNLTGSPICGNNVTNMFSTYKNCHNLIGSPVCGNNVTSMYGTYYGCTNLTGNPVCGNKVTDMSNAYRGCTNLTGNPICGNNVTDMSNAYYNCKNLSAGDMYVYAPNIINVGNCFWGKNNSRRYNIHVPANSTTFNTFIINNASSLVGKTITYTNNGACWYNTAYNIYIYPIKSLSEKLIDFNYTENPDGTVTLTSWKGTYNGEPSTKFVIPRDSRIIL